MYTLYTILYTILYIDSIYYILYIVHCTMYSVQCNNKM